MIGRSASGVALAALVFAAWAGLLAYTQGVLPLEAAVWAGAPLLALQCWLFVGLFILGHDAMHGTLAPAWPGLNAAIGRLALFAYVGFPFDATRRKHHLHHRHAGLAEDPDHHGSNRFWPWYGAFLKQYFRWSNAVFVSAVLSGLLLFGVPWQKALLFWAAPAVLSSLQLFAFGTYLPHRRTARQFPDHHHARSNDWPEWVSLFTCFHFGYHHEHHLEPGEPWWRLPAQRRRRRSSARTEAQA